TGHPLATGQLSMSDWLAAEHVVPTPYSVGQRGVVDVFLARERMRRNVVAHVPYFHMAPFMLINSDLIFTAPSTPPNAAGSANGSCVRPVRHRQPLACGA
ncbi:MAG: hypothetical protein PHG21_05860, partial [Azoarcus sp.]|nr:hypothetical protein [Azoarcus sp.]